MEEVVIEVWELWVHGGGNVQAVYCHQTYLTYMQYTSCKMPGWIKHKLESRLLGKISITSEMQMTLLLWHYPYEKELKSFLIKVKEKSIKAGLKQHSEN